MRPATRHFEIQGRASRAHRALVRCVSAVIAAHFVRFAVAQAQSTEGSPATRPVPTDTTADTAAPRTGAAAMEQGDLAGAAILLRQEADARPGDAVALARLARIQELTGDAPAARKTLDAAIAAETDPARGVELRLRAAAADYEARSPAGAAALLAMVARGGPVPAMRAGVLAVLYGDDATAIGCLAFSDEKNVALRLLAGNAALRAGRLPEAEAAFTQALAVAVQDGDRLYAQERLIATARRAGTLARLADAWLATPDLPAERFIPLAAVLRESGRTPDLLAWWQRRADANAGSAVFTKRVVAELVGAAQAAGESDRAEAICRTMLAREPQSEQWLSVLLRLLLRAQKADRADALLETQIRSATTPARLKALGHLADTLGRDAPALAAARTLGAYGGADAIEGKLREAAVRLRAGDRDAATAALKAAAAMNGPLGAMTENVAAAMEAAHLDAEAIALLKTAADARPDGPVLEHLAALMASQKPPQNATPVLERILHSATSPAVREQTAQELVAAADAGGALPALVARTADRARAGQADHGDLALLINAYGRAKDQTSAVELLRSTPLLDGTEKLRRVSVVSLKNDRVEEAVAALNRLVEADPAHAVETLQQIAVVAMKADLPKVAADAIDRLQSRLGEGPQSLMLLAGLFNQIGRFDRAADCYRRALAADPNDPDAWLLWAQSMARSGRSAAAVARLQLLCGDGGNDTVRGVAADGLLNLNAPARALRSARQDLVLRLTADPTRPLLYPVLGDLCEESRDRDFAVRLSGLRVPMSGGEQAAGLRELMGAAGEAAMTELSIECGQALLTLGDNFPPQLFLELGEQLLATGRTDDARRAFDRATEASSEDQVAPRVADVLARYGDEAGALERLRPLLDRKAGDAGFVQGTARLEEIVGRTDAAFGHYCDAFTITSRDARLAALSTQSDDAGTSARADLNRAANGALATARTPAARQALLRLLESEAGHAVADVPAGRPPGEAVDTLTRTLRRVCFALHAPDVADRADAALLRRWPGEPDLARAMLSDRIESGLYANAARFAADHALPTSITVTRLGPLVDGVAFVTPSPMTAESAAGLLPALLAHGGVRQAQAVLAAVPPRLPVPTYAQRSAMTRAGVGPSTPAAVLVAAAAAMGMDDVATQWALLWLQAVATPPAAKGRSPASAPSQDVPSVSGAQTPLVRHVIASTWRLLSDDGRSRLTKAVLSLLSNTQDTGAKSELALTVLRINAAGINAAGLPVAVLPRELGDTALRGAAPNSDSAAQCFAVLPAADRPAFLRDALERSRPEDRLALLERIIDRAVEPLDASSAAEVVRAAETIVGPQAVEFSGWYANAAQTAVLPAVARAAVRAVGPQPGDVNGAGHLLAAAAAFSVGGDGAGADALARSVLDAIMADRVRPAEATPGGPTSAAAVVNATTRASLLRFGIGVLSGPAKTRLLADLSTPAGTAALLAKGLVLEGLGRYGDALDAIRDAYARAPADQAVSRTYMSRLAADGRAAELVDVFAPRLETGSLGPTDGPSPVLDACASLFRMGQMTRLQAANAEGASVGPDYQTPLVRNDLPGLARVLRVQLERQRTSSWTATSVLQADPGGLWAEPDPRAGLPDVDPDALLTWPGSADDLSAALRARPTGSRFGEPRWAAVPRLIAGAARKDAGLEARLLAGLRAAETADAVTTADRAVWTELVARPGPTPTPMQTQVPTAALLRGLWSAAVLNDGVAAYRTLADVMTNLHDPGASAVSRWADFASRATDAGSNAPVLLSPTPVDTLINDDHTADVLRRLARNDAPLAERTLANLSDTGRLTPQHSRCALLRAELAAGAWRHEDVRTPSRSGRPGPGLASGHAGIRLFYQCVAAARPA